MAKKSMTGAERIAAERLRQIDKEDWTPEHDYTEHVSGELARAAACYALPRHLRMSMILGTPLLDWLWPWDRSWWKPTEQNRIKELTKAGALIAAEIDRLLRKEAKV